MDSNYKSYNFETSCARIDGILAQPMGNFKEVAELPDRDELTYTNGFYANCSAMFIDIRDSSKLPDVYKRPALAKIYRAFISEEVAIFNGLETAREINITGDCVWGVYNTPKKYMMDELFSASARANSLVDVLNVKLKKAGYETPIRVGIGLSYGRALMIQAGFSGSGINDVVYMGDVVNAAAKLAAKGGKGLSGTMMIASVVYENLNDENRSLLNYNWANSCYEGTVVNVAMNDWVKANS